MRQKTPVNLLALVALLATVAAPVFAKAPLVAGQLIVVPDTKGGFDFLEFDATKRRLLADHTGNGTLDIFDAADGKLIKSVTTGSAQGVTVDEVGGKYHVSVSKQTKLVSIDRETLEVTREIALSGPADALVFNPKNGCAYVGHDDAKELWVVDVKSGKVAATVAIAEGPEYVIYDAASDRIFQNIKSNDTVSVIAPGTNTVTESWSTKPATKPHGLAMEAKTNRLFISGTNGELVVLDAKTGKVTASAKIAPGVDQIAFDAELRRVYCASSSGVISVVQITDDGAASLGDVKTAKGAKTLTVDPQTHAVWTAYADGAAAYVLKLDAEK
jgi:DNA-binding beta-propeller fold protein YncE